MNLDLFKIGGSWSTTISIVLGVVLFLWIWLKFGDKIRAFLREVGVELRKCSWPWDPEKKGVAKYKELIDATWVVIACTLMLAGFVTCVDFLLMRAFDAILRH